MLDDLDSELLLAVETSIAGITPVAVVGQMTSPSFSKTGLAGDEERPTSHFEGDLDIN